MLFLPADFPQTPRPPSVLTEEVIQTMRDKVNDPFAKYFPGGFTVRDEANALTAWAFRNGPLEDLHAGAYSPLLEDDSLSRITDAEMKTLMLHACRQLAELLALKRDNPEEYDLQIKSYAFRYCRSWER